jgi:RNA polymerase sigma-70 factor (sigma-E family)
MVDSMETGLPSPVVADGGRSADAYRPIFVAHHAPLVRFAYLLGCDPAQLEDVVADAFVDVYPRWQDGSVLDVGAYLRRSVVNQVRDRARRRRTRSRWEASVAHAVPAQSTEDTGDRERIVRALSYLSDDLRATVVLRFFDDLTEAQTAEVLGVAVGTVKSRTARALSRLRETLKESDDE